MAGAAAASGGTATAGGNAPASCCNVTGGTGVGADEPPPSGIGVVSGTSSGRKANGPGKGAPPIDASPAAPPGTELKLGSAGCANAAGGDGVVGSAPDSSREADDGPKPTAAPGNAA